MSITPPDRYRNLRIDMYLVRRPEMRPVESPISISQVSPLNLASANSDISFREAPVWAPVVGDSPVSDDSQLSVDVPAAAHRGNVCCIPKIVRIVFVVLGMALTALGLRNDSIPLLFVGMCVTVTAATAICLDRA